MTDLNKELHEYLLSNKNENESKISQFLPTIKTPNLGNWFGRGEDRQEQGWFNESQKDFTYSMTRMQRMSAFAVCLLLGIFCFCLSTIYIPVLLFKARKFALLYSLGSLFFLLSFSFLWGFKSYFKSLLSTERRYFSLSYFATLIGTLYFALHLQSTSLTVLSAVLQLIAMSFFVVSHIPGGTTGLMFCTKMFKSSVTSTLNV